MLQLCVSSYERLWRTAGGFFTDAPDSDYALAIIDGAFAKSLVIKLVRKVLVMLGTFVHSHWVGPCLLSHVANFERRISLPSAGRERAVCWRHCRGA